MWQSKWESNVAWKVQGWTNWVLRLGALLLVAVLAGSFPGLVRAPAAAFPTNDHQTCGAVGIPSWGFDTNWT